jgi:nucleoside-diphosphate-sugar epimerase
MPRRGELDIGRARDTIGFAPKVDLEEGLRRYHEYLVDQRSRGVW